MSQLNYRRRLLPTLAAALAVTTATGLIAPSAQAATVKKSTVPFVAASVTPATAGTWTVSWKALKGVKTVKVYVGSSATSFAKKPVKTAKKRSASITVSSTSVHPFVKLVGSVGAPLVVTNRALGLASALNLRDIGGYRTVHGQWVRSGVVYRSPALTLTPLDAEVVNTLGITGDYDLRTTAEATAKPDVVPGGAIYSHLNVMGDNGSTAISATTADQAAQFMTDAEVSFVDSASAKAAYKALFSSILTDRGASLYHCTAGKDRTGWATAALLTLLGVAPKTVLSDYLLSNTYYLNSPAVQAQLNAMPPTQRAVYEPFMEVRPAYLQAGLDRVTAEYGSMRNYFVNGLGLSPATVTALKAKLLVGAAA